MHSTLQAVSPDRCHVVIIPLACKSWDCPICAPIKRNAWLARIRSGSPTRFITLTFNLAHHTSLIADARTMKVGFRKLVSRIRRVYHSFEYAAVWEVTHRGLPHLHLLYRGSYIPKAWLSKQWDNLVGAPIVDIQAIHHHAAAAIECAKYLGKHTGQTAYALAPMRIVQLSSRYDLSPKKVKQLDDLKWYTWHRIRQSPHDCIECWLAYPRAYDCQHNSDGTVEIFLLPEFDPLKETPSYLCYRPGETVYAHNPQPTLDLEPY